MSVVQVTLTPEELAAAYAQLDTQERNSFLAAVFDQPAQQQAALDLLVAARKGLKRRFSPRQQQLLDSLLLRPKERRQLDELMAAYGAGLIDKARANYVLHVAQQAEVAER